MIMPKIIRNAIRCKKCGDVIESKTVHDFKFCSCGSCAVDGGHDYLRRCGNREDWEELSEAEKVEESEEAAPIPTATWELTIRQRGEGGLQFILLIDGERTEATVHFQQTLVDKLVGELLAGRIVGLEFCGGI